MSLKDEHGFTLVETIIALSITAILAFAVMNFMVDGIVNFSQEQTRSDLLNETHSALDIINNDVRLSANADENNRWQDNNAPGAPSDLLSWQSNANTLVLAGAVEDSSNNIVFQDPSQYISYKNNYIFFVQNGILYKRTLAAPVAGNTAKTTCPAALATSSCPADRQLASNVSVFTVKYINGEGAEVQPADARSIEVTLTLNVRKFKSDLTETYTTRMVFRND